MSTIRSRLAAPRTDAGVTLIELIVAIVIIGVAIAGLTAALTRSNRVSADPLIEQQKIAIAESLMGEILLKPFTVDAGPITAGVRNSFNDVYDFNKYGLDASNNPVYGITDVDGNAIAALASYGAAVVIDKTTPITNVPANSVMKITITVRRTGDNPEDAFVLTGWRTKPW
jgi:MSHA pilin protein MshD